MRTLLILAASFFLVTAPGLEGQEGAVTSEVLREVVPSATRFGPKEGDPPVFRAYAMDPETGQEALVGFAFLTSDFLPRETGYDGPIESLVGLDLEGTLTGARVLRYNESHRRTLGDFLRRPGFQEQFTGKHVTDPFRVRRDIQNLSGATISVQAMVRAIRNASRSVATAYLTTASGAVVGQDSDGLEWMEVVEGDLAHRLVGADRGAIGVELFLIPLRDAGMGRTLMGDAYDQAVSELEEVPPGGTLWMIAIDGSRGAMFRPGDLTLVVGQDTIGFDRANMALTGEPRAGTVDGQVRNVGLLALEPGVDAEQPFTWSLDIGGLGVWTAQLTRAPRVEVAAGAVPAEGAGVEESEPPPPPVPGDAEEEVAESVADTLPEEVAVAPSPAPPTPTAEPTPPPGGDARPPEEAPIPPLDLSLLGFDGQEEESLLARTLENTSWRQFGVMAVALLLATAAFFRKSPALRWTALAFTLLALGWGGGGFLSISHITSGLKVGPGVYAENLTLLLLVTFTVITTLLWGRVFCGFLCPFGALQDFLDRVVPSKLRRRLPRPVQDRGRYVKYGVLAVVVLPAVLTQDVVVYHFFEPFGTVFFLSPSKLLWGIAIAILLASLAIPRFYCRYLCPLGAALALGSLLSPFRIRRVPQCEICTVCEHACPTGAIRGEQIDFHECVRCNACEVKLITRAGVCRHDMEKVSKLVQIKGRPKSEVTGVS